MMGYGYDMGAGGWIAMTIFWFALVVLVVWTITRLLPTGSDARPAGAPSPGPGPEDPASIVDRRFAEGELDEETYRSMRAALRAARGASPQSR